MCAKCGGGLRGVKCDDPRVKGKDVPSDRELLLCECGQVYWESSSETGSSKRSLRLAEKLFEMVEQSQERGGEVGGAQCGSEIVREGMRDCDCGKSGEGSEVKREHWLRFRSAAVEANEKEPIYTNVNGDFQGCLDYVFVGGSCSVIQTSVLQGVNDTITSFPNHDWPSDHMALMVNVSMDTPEPGRPAFPRSFSCPSLNLLKTHSALFQP